MVLAVKVDGSLGVPSAALRVFATARLRSFADEVLLNVLRCQLTY